MTFIPDDRIKVVVWLWEPLTGKHPRKDINFTAEHVNIFFRMLSRHTNVAYEPVCITSYPPELFDSHIRIIPLWQDLREMGGCYTRLKAFSSQMKYIIGKRFMWIDLDTVICGNVDHILNDPSDLKFFGDTHVKTHYNGSLCMMNAGVREDIWASFNPKTSPKEPRRKGIFGTDQAWISHVLGPSLPKFGPADGIYSFRMHLQKMNKTELPDNACMVMFHGRYDPSMPLIQRQYPWVAQYYR